MVEQLSPKGWAQLGESSRIHSVSASTKHLHPSCRPPLKGCLTVSISSIEALQVPSSIEHG